MKESKQRFQLLLVEDSEADAELVRILLEETCTPAELHVAPNGHDALSRLRREGEFAAGPMPDIVLLDLNLPGKSGREILAEMKADPGLRRLPVLVLSSSDDPKDISRSYELGANAYLTKPPDVIQYGRLMEALSRFWFYHAAYPEKNWV